MHHQGRDTFDGIFSRKVVERMCKKKLCEWLTAKFPWIDVEKSVVGDWLSGIFPPLAVPDLGKLEAFNVLERKECGIESSVVWCDWMDGWMDWRRVRMNNKSTVPFLSFPFFLFNSISKWVGGMGARDEIVMKQRVGKY